MDHVEIRASLETYLRGMAKDSSIWFGADIPPKKLKAAIASYAPGVVEERVIALHDRTVFGGADEGFLVTDAAFYGRDIFGYEGTVEIRFNDLQGVEHVALVDGRASVRVSRNTEPMLCLVTSERFQDDTVGPWIKRFVYKVIAMREQGVLTTEDRYVIVQDMAEEFRVEYVKMAVLLALSDDNEISSLELAEVQLLMTRLELSQAARRRLWRFVAGNRVSTEAVLEELERLAPKGALPVLVLSLLKDLMAIARRREKGVNASADAFIVAVAQRYGVSVSQREFIEQALVFDESVVSGSVKASQLRRMGTELAAKSAAVGVPLVAVYLSGSVIGLSAAGITSGLAALGFGGLFGLGAMVSGIGTVLLLSVAIYQIVRWLTGSEEKELAALRERLMQEVVRQLQRTVNALVGDIQMLTYDVVDLTRQAEIDKVRMQRLAQDLQALTGAMSTLSQRAQQGRDTTLAAS
jgi:predicted nucleic acid-binding protein